MAATREYRDLGDEIRSTRTVLESRAGEYGREHRLEHLSAGWAPAGSCARWQSEAWAVGLVDRSGGRHGQQYRTLAEAQQDWNSIAWRV